MTKKAFVSGYNKASEGRLLVRHGFQMTDTIEEADLVVFTGGADISPELYGEPTHGTTYPQENRDIEDQASYLCAVAMGIPMLGICRGAQFLCAMTGGKLWQNVSKHQGEHTITNADTGEVIITNSVHHQAMRPGPEAIIHWEATHECYATRWDEGEKKFVTVIVDKIAEIVTFPAIKAVAVQGHPEYDSESLRLLPFRSAVFKLLNTFQEQEAPTPSTV